MNNYPEPAANPICECRVNPMRAFFCSQGHLLECHAGYDCAMADCAHLAKYDFEPAEFTKLQSEARKRIEAGLMPPYEIDADGNIAVNLQAVPARSGGLP